MHISIETAGLCATQNCESCICTVQFAWIGQNIFISFDKNQIIEKWSTNIFPRIFSEFAQKTSSNVVSLE